MAIEKFPLNNQAPPTWSNADGSAPVPPGDVTETATKLRHIDNQDRLNYFTSQRYQGDLFYRDWRLDTQINGVIDYLATKTGLTYNLPLAEIHTGKYAVLARFTVPFPNLICVAAQCTAEGGPSADVLIALVRVSDDFVYFSCTSAALFAQDGATLVPSGVEVELRVSNNSGAAQRVQASMVLQPRTY